MLISNCKQCGVEIREPNHTKVRTFCSKHCQGDWISLNETGRNSPNWKELKDYMNSHKAMTRMIRRRDIHCQYCGSSKRLTVHHKDADHFNNSDDNAILICRECHAKEHPEVANLILAGTEYRKVKVMCNSCGKEFYKPRPKVSASNYCGCYCFHNRNSVK